MKNNQEVKNLADLCGVADDSVVDEDKESIDTIDTNDIDIDSINETYDDLELPMNIESYYLCGVENVNGTPKLKMSFTFKKEEIYTAMIHSSQYNTMSPEEKLNFRMEYHAKLGSALICAAYTNTVDGLLWVVKAEKSGKIWSEKELAEYIESKDISEIEQKSINMEDLLTDYNLD